MPRHTAKPTQAHPRNARGATTPGQAPVTSQRLLPLGALAAGFGLLNSGAWAQTAPEAPAPAASAASAPAARPETTMQPISVKAKAESDATSLRAATTGVAKGSQDIMDVPQAVTIITERLMNDRQVDTLNEALHLMGGISFLAAEGGEQDIRLRGFSISGDIYDHSRPRLLRPRRLRLRAHRAAARLGVDVVRARLDRRCGQSGV